ncbi:MAG: DNA repair exonuclease [Nitrospinaceae bacterium]|jgi:DNA repair exonuclease SbcCD nuclease subunit|nr:DNA repair exonuclease [Nitrospinaceae bacterium]|tara:strand:- start:4212 stop:5468 length:1257 start_codon:yes stop_codon:yes gene_type:complete
MPTFRFLHCSDLHIDSPFKGLSSVQPSLAERFRNSTYLAFQNIVKLALQEEVDAVLIAGDIYDGSDKSLQAQLKFRRGLQELSDAGIDTFIVHGNHDPLDGWSASLDWPERVHVFSGTQVERQPVIKNGIVKAHVHGISYPTRDVKENLALKFIRDDKQGFAIGLLHTNVGHQAGHDDYAPCSMDDLVAGNMDYWALGHIHSFQVLRESSPAVVYSGNTQSRHMRETGEKGCCLVTLHKNASPVIQFIPTDVVRYVHDEVDLSGRISLEEVIHAVRAKCERLADQIKERDVFVNLSLNGRTQVHSELKRGDTLESLQEEIRTYFEGRTPSVWLSLKLETDGLYDIESLRQGKDFTADLITLFGEEGRLETHPDLKEALKPMFETWQGKKHLEYFSDAEMKDILIQARSLCLDKLLSRD